MKHSGNVLLVLCAFSDLSYFSNGLISSNDMILQDFSLNS